MKLTTKYGVQFNRMHMYTFSIRCGSFRLTVIDLITCKRQIQNYPLTVQYFNG